MNETTDATDIFGPIWRRKWLILAVAIVVGAASYFYYKRERPTYQASTQVFLGASAEEQLASEKSGSKSRGAALSDQAAVINAIVVEKVHHQLRAEHKGALVRGSKVRAKSAEKSEFITISTEAHSAHGAALLANLVAQSYIRRQNANRRRSIEASIAITRRQLRRIEAASVPKPAPKTSTSKEGGSSSSSSSAASSNSTSRILQAANLSSKINQLEASLTTTGAQQVKPATAKTAQLISPKPRKDAIFGFVIGLVLAAIAAYAFSRFDRRLRSLAVIEGIMGAPILTALPKVGRPIIRREGDPYPSAALLEPLRRLHTALRLGEQRPPDAAQQSPGRVILVVSADPGDGKSTLVADLALVQREAGERVVVVEANFRRPVQAGLLGLSGQQGLGDVLAGSLTVEEAMQRVMPPHAAATQPGDGGEGIATAVQAGVGSLFVLAGGGPVANPPALLAHEAAPELLRSLAAEFDYVLIDAPSPLEVSDAIPLLGVVGGILVVARAGHTRENSARRLAQLLQQPANAPVLGVAVNFVARADLKRYGFYSPNGRVWPGRLTGR